MSKKKRAGYRGEPDAPDNILRDVSRRHPLDLARAWATEDKPIRKVAWAETQFSARQRRLDRVLQVHTQEKPFSLHIEWSLRWTRRVHRQIFEYHQLATLAAETDAQMHKKQGRQIEALPMKSVLVVLSGRKKPLPKYGRYQTSLPGEKFSGVQYRIEAIYQKTVKQIEAMGGDFWLVFVPLAVDINQEKLVEVLDGLAARTNQEEFCEFVAAMISLAALRKDMPNLGNVIRSFAPKGKRMRHLFYIEGVEDGVAKGLKKGLKEGRMEGLAFFIRVLEKKLQRDLTASERRRIASRWEKLGPDKLGDVAVDFTPKQLEAWLALNGHRKAA